MYSFLMLYLISWLTRNRLVKRPAIIAQLLYHTARILLAKTHPLESELSPEMQRTQKKHARDICGIVARMKDRYAGNTLSPVRLAV